MLVTINGCFCFYFTWLAFNVCSFKSSLLCCFRPISVKDFGPYYFKESVQKVQATFFFLGKTE